MGMTINRYKFTRLWVWPSTTNGSNDSKCVHKSYLLFHGNIQVLKYTDDNNYSIKRATVHTVVSAWTIIQTQYHGLLPVLYRQMFIDKKHD